MNIFALEQVQQCYQWLYKKGLQYIYRNAENSEKLPWYESKPPQILINAINNRKGTGWALDIGCGTGNFSIFLAKQNYKVTGVDYINESISLAVKHAAQAKVEVEFINADILKWQPVGKYDLILDAGCVHGITGKARNDYKERLLQWLEYGGDYILLHFEKKHFFDFYPIGPRRYSRKKIIEWLSPELEEKEYIHVNRVGSFPIGPVISIGSYRFQKKGLK